MNFFFLLSLTGVRQAWDLGPFAAMLAPGHTPPLATKRKENTQTKNVSYAIRANSGQKNTKRPKTQPLL